MGGRGATLHVAETGSAAGVEDLAQAANLHFMHYDFARPHQSFKESDPRTPAMAAGVANDIRSREEIAALLEQGHPVSSWSRAKSRF